jgi:DNA polymerase
MITFDFETKSYADLKKVGAWAYSEDPTTEVICCAWAIDDGEIETWWPGKDTDYTDPMLLTPGSINYCSPEMPHSLQAALQSGHEVEAHNVGFERSIWMNIMQTRYGWVLPYETQWRDTMAVACYYALPAALDRLSRVLGFEGKNADGGRLITKYSKLHLKTAKAEIPDEDFQKFVEYCVDDVALERAVSNELGDLPDREIPVFQLDQRVNLRGLHLDIEGIETASRVVEQRAATLTAEFNELTGFNPSQNAKVQAWFAGEGLMLDNLQKGYLEDVIEEGELPSGRVRRALELRLSINKASTKKLDAMARNKGADGRARFQTRYHGAVTGRWTGSGFQPLNLKRGYGDMDPEQLVGDIKHGDAEWLDCLYGDAMEAVANASRYWIKADDGNRIIAGDFVSIEAVILACLAGEQWKVDAFRAGVKLYEHMADKIYGFPTGTVTKATHPAERFDGKTGELAFGYQGALGAWLKFDNSGRHTDERIIEICRAWRGEHPQTVALWRGLEQAAISAVANKISVTYGRITFETVDSWLSMILPDGKRIWYWEPELAAGRPVWCKPEVHDKCRDGECDHDEVLKLTYMAQKEGQWRRVNTYGGKLTENACQAVSRQILVPAMLRAEEAGYGIILSVYDEIVCEVPKDFGSIEEFTEIMSGPLPGWCSDWPVSVDAWEGERYKK